MKSIPNIRSALWILCLLASPAILTSQNLPNNSFNNVQTIVCPYDSTSHWGFDEWRAFQTDDSTRWGQRDSLCIPTGTPSITGAAIRVNDIDLTRPVYLDAILADSGVYVNLDSNSLYKVSVNHYPNNPSNWDWGTGCKEDLCSGMELGVEIPDSAGTGVETRWYKHQPMMNQAYYEFCFPTERFPNANSISRAWLKYTATNGATVVDSVRISNIYIEDMRYWTEQIKRIDANYFNGTSYEYYMNQWTGGCITYACSNKLLMYNDSTYPSQNAISYVDVAPFPNTTTQEVVDIIIDWNVFLTAQPFTELRGAEVVGSTLRHNFNIINNGGTVCTYGFIDVVFENGNNYEHRAGKVSFGSKQACMLFGRGSTLEVADGTTFHYGAPGRGMLALKTGGKLTIGRGSELVIHNKLIFGEYKEDSEPADIHIYLDRGSKLTFAEGSELSNQLSKFKDECLLNVHLRGGVLDDSGLSAEDRKLIRRIYDDPREEFAANVELLGNPFDGNLQFSVLGEGGEQIEMILYGMDGKKYVVRETQLSKGYNQIELNTAQLPAAIYLLQLDNGDATVTKRVLKMN